MNSALIETAPVGGDGPALGAGARGGVDGLELELAAAVKDDDEVDEAAEAGEPGADAMLGIDGSVGDEKGGGEADAAAQGVLIDRRGGVWGGVAAVAREGGGDEGAEVGGDGGDIVEGGGARVYVGGHRGLGHLQAGIADTDISGRAPSAEASMARHLPEQTLS